MSQAATFKQLHAGPQILVLPNAWDAASAALMEDAGAKAVATSSAAVLEIDPDLHARKIQAVRKAAGAGLFVNARTDVYLRGLAQGEAALAETLRRAELYRAAGADGIFVPGPIDEALLETLAREIALPLNVMGRGGAPSAERLQALGVRRLSSATAPFRAAYAALGRAMSEFLASGDANALAQAGQGLPDLNKRFGG